MEVEEHKPIFGTNLKGGIDENINVLFKEKAGPLKRAEVIRNKKTEKKAENKEETDDLEMEETTEVSDFERNEKKRKKSKKIEENEDLEEEYFARTLTEERTVKRQKKDGKLSKTKEEETDNVKEKKEEEFENPENVERDVKSSEENHETDQSETHETDEKPIKNDQEKNKDTEKYTHESLLKSFNDVDQAKLTVFIGNCPITAITDKKIYKKLQNLFKKYGKISSIRFRSIGFSEILPRKAAFTMKKFHEKRDSANAYIAYQEESSIKKAVDELNGTEFENHHLRVDSLAHPKQQDNKKCVFVGNLDFDESEESLWRHFKSCGDVENVRIVRDSKTNIGKGFAYVQYKDSIFVSKALLLDGKQMKSFNRETRRVLRVTRCKDSKKMKNIGEKSDKKTINHGKIRLSSLERSRIGKARSMVGKAGKAKIDKLVEGHRAKPGEMIKGLTGGKKKRITKRSSGWKEKGKRKH